MVYVWSVVVFVFKKYLLFGPLQKRCLPIPTVHKCLKLLALLNKSDLISIHIFQIMFTTTSLKGPVVYMLVEESKISCIE